ncbi:MAG: putative photosynthetic complex assembly protein PuhE [Pseudomonadota bacterium]
MSTLLPILFVISLWWAGTALILMGVHRPVRHHLGMAQIMTLGTAALTALIVPMGTVTSPWAAFASFAMGIALWAWHEMMFLFGYISGPRKSPCPQNINMGKRFILSTQTVIHHEVMIAIHAAILIALSWGAANSLACQTFLLLWLMRMSTKLMLFFGAPNIADHFLPAHLSYLASYFRKERNQAVSLLALCLAITITVSMGYGAYLADTGSFAWIGFVLLTSLAALAVLEHLALALPLGESVMWEWAIGHRNTSMTTTSKTEMRGP